jgi:hypothetical protein
MGSRFKETFLKFKFLCLMGGQAMHNVLKLRYSRKKTVFACRLRLEFELGIGAFLTTLSASEASFWSTIALDLSPVAGNTRSIFVWQG